MTCRVGWKKKQRLVRYFCEFGYLDLLGPMFSGHLNTFEANLTQSSRDFLALVRVICQFSPKGGTRIRFVRP